MKKYSKEHKGFVLYESSNGELVYLPLVHRFYYSTSKNSLSGWWRSGVVTLRELELECERKEKYNERGKTVLRKILIDFEKEFSEDYELLKGDM